MIENWELLYKEMMSAVQECWQLDVLESQQIKKAYKITIGYLHRLENQIKKYTFDTQEDEFFFHKNVKSKFTSYIEYLHLTNQAHLFIFNQTKEFVEDYWNFEANRLNRFIQRNIEFAEFYKIDGNEYNLQDFLSANYDLGNFMVSKPYDFNDRFIKSHEHFIACFQAHKMYNEYVEEKLKNYIEA